MKYMSVIRAGLAVSTIVGLLAVIGQKEQDNERLKTALAHKQSVINVLSRTLLQNIDRMTEEQVFEMMQTFDTEKDFEELINKLS